MKFSEYLESKKISKDKALEFVVGDGGGILPQKVGFQGYFCEIADDGLIFTNDVLGVENKKILFSSIHKAEFGLKSGQLWLQLDIDGAFFAFCLRRSHYKSVAGQLLLDKIDAQLGITLREDREYKRYTGKLWLLWAIVTA